MHRLLFRRRFVLLLFEPAEGLNLAAQSAPKRPFEVQRLISQGSECVVLRIFRWLRSGQQRCKRLLQKVFRLRERQSQCSPVQQKLRGFIFVKPLAPGHIFLSLFSHPAQKTPLKCFLYKPPKPRVTSLEDISQSVSTLPNTNNASISLQSNSSGLRAGPSGDFHDRESRTLMKPIKPESE